MGGATRKGQGSGSPGGAGRGTHGGVLALHAGAVEAQGGHPLLHALDVENAFVPALPGLWLREVLGLQSDGLDHLHRDQELVHSQQLGAVLERQHSLGWGAGSGSGRQPRCLPCSTFPRKYPQKVLDTAAHPWPLCEGERVREIPDPTVTVWGGHFSLKLSPDLFGFHFNALRTLGCLLPGPLPR